MSHTASTPVMGRTVPSEFGRRPSPFVDSTVNAARSVSRRLVLGRVPVSCLAAWDALDRRQADFTLHTTYVAQRLGLDVVAGTGNTSRSRTPRGRSSAPNLMGEKSWDF
jgi:hypothetical protein